MRRGDGPPHDGRHAPRWVGESQGDAVGPQGAALILELQRLRQAFELEDAGEPQAPQPRRSARENLHPAARQRTRQPKRRRKGKMGRAIDVCLEQFGFTAAAPASRRSEPAHEPVSAGCTSKGTCAGCSYGRAKGQTCT